MTVPGRQFSNGNQYRYGFQTQEKSTEINESSFTAEFWQYDARIGRRWNVDPMPNISLSPYSAFMNSPIWMSDHLGDTSIITPGGKMEDIGDYGFETFDGGAYNLQKSNITIQPFGGSLKSITTFTGEKFVATFGDKSGKFFGFYNAEKLDQSLGDWENDEEGKEYKKEILGKLWNFFSPVGDVDLYVSGQIKATKKTEVLGKEIKGVVPSGGQVGFNFKDGFFNQTITPEQSYVNLKTGIIENRTAPFNGVGKGDYGLTGTQIRTLITLRKFTSPMGDAKVQGDIIMGVNRIAVGSRISAETRQVNIFGFKGTGEFSIGARFEFKKPQIFKFIGF